MTDISDWIRLVEDPIQKSRIYVKRGQKPPKGVVTRRGNRGGTFYETRKKSSAPKAVRTPGPEQHAPSNRNTDFRRFIRLRILAEDVYYHAKSYADTSLKDISNAAGKYDGELVGTDFRLKTPDSIQRKIKERIRSGATPAEATKSIQDVVRFTAVHDTATYTASINAILDDLESEGYTVTKVKNYWNRNREGYKGVHCKLETKEGQILELQFHTQETWHIKQEVSHPVYEELRIARTDEERKRLVQKTKDIWKDVEFPKGIEGWRRKLT